MVLTCFLVIYVNKFQLFQLGLTATYLVLIVEVCYGAWAEPERTGGSFVVLTEPKEGYFVTVDAFSVKHTNALARAIVGNPLAEPPSTGRSNRLGGRSNRLG
jgi:hypothetical protein